jgi:hypothetical protein
VNTVFTQGKSILKQRNVGTWELSVQGLLQKNMKRMYSILNGIEGFDVLI